jgi:ABC-2 type transport system ATP-binding protein
MIAMEEVIRVENLKKYFGPVRAVDGISLAVKKGEVFGFLGPNGAGKTTTIRLLMDFLRPDAGKILIPKKESLGYLSGDVRLYANWTGREHIAFVEGLRGRCPYVNKLREKFVFDEHQKVKNLSLGNRQKLGLILALMHEPEVLILDEPTLGLDPLLQNAIYEILAERATKGSAIFMSSHNLYEVERVCDRVSILKEGKIVATETIPEERKKTAPRSPLEKIFLEFYQ